MRNTVLIFSAAIMFAGGSIFGQAAVPQARAPVRASALPLKVKEVTKPSKCEQETPSFARASSGRKQKWGVLDAVFDVFPEWIDSMSVKFTVMCEKTKPKPGEKKFSLLEITSSYSDVMRERDRKVGVIIPPNKLKKVGLPIGFVVQFYVGDKLVDGKSDEEGKLAGRSRWWEDPAIVDTGRNKNLEKVNGVMLERSETVFGYVDMDNYEVSK